MSKKHNTVQALVYRTLEDRVEVGGSTEFRAIQNMSQNQIDAFIRDFRANKAHLLNKTFKDSTVNRYVEMYIKSNHTRF